MPLYSYPAHKHILHLTTYNKKKLFANTPKYEIVCEILQVVLNKEQDRKFKITFLEGKFTHDTEAFGKMTTFIRLKVNDKKKWDSEVNMDGDQYPTYKQTTQF